GCRRPAGTRRTRSFVKSRKRAGYSENHPFAGGGRNEIRAYLRSVVARPHVVFYRVKNDESNHDRCGSRRAHICCRHLGWWDVCDLCLFAPGARHAGNAAALPADADHVAEFLSLGVGGDPAITCKRLLDGICDIWWLSARSTA